MKKRIPIKNIYHMLCYAWNIEPDGELIKSSYEDFDNVIELYTVMLLREVNILVKRGFYKGYHEVEEELALAKGKIDMTRSLNRNSLLQRKLVCHYDEFSSNVFFNQIVKTTLLSLLRKEQVNNLMKADIAVMVREFEGVDEIYLTASTFTMQKVNRNNKHYTLAIGLCELIYKAMLLNQETEELIGIKYVSEAQMAALYEKFLLNFFKRRLPSRYKVYAPHFTWNLDNDYENVGVGFLPRMRSDIVIENRILKKQLIIDAKFYREAMKSSHRSEAKKLISGNLYQIMNYVHSSDYDGEVSGMLLYPVNGLDFQFDYRIDGYRILVGCVDLGVDWWLVEERLMAVCDTL